MKKLSIIFFVLVISLVVISCSDTGAGGGGDEADGDVVYRDYLVGTSWSDSTVDNGATLVFDATEFTLTTSEPIVAKGTVNTDLLAYDDVVGLTGAFDLDFDAPFKGISPSEIIQANTVTDTEIFVSIDSDSGLVYSGLFSED